MNKSFVSYSDFGAIGDGVTNDFFALKAAHEYANENGLPVRAEADKTYLITETETNGIADTISIKTDTDWCGATIIIDDTNVRYTPGTRKKFAYNVFFVESYYPRVNVDEKYIEKINAAGGISRDNTKKIETGLGYPAMLVITNEKTRHFIRFGGNENSGVYQKELVLVDADGNIDESTPFLFDFENVSSIVAIRVDIPTLTLKNGTVISKASRVNIYPEYRAIARGIGIIRPNTHVNNIVHKIEGELEKYEPVREDAEGLSYPVKDEGFYYRDGAIYTKDGEKYEGADIKPFIGHSYNGIISINMTHNVLIEDFVFQARVYYLQGTYDLTGNTANRLVYKNCRQSNFRGGNMPEHPRMLGLGKWWGVAGTNYCKNMVYDGCQLTRYDAHSGVCNGKIINSEVGSVRLTGGGDMLIENSTIYYWNHLSPIQLREDYGVTWQGNITIRNTKMECVKEDDTMLSSILVMQSANWNFGYKTYFPNITLDNFRIDRHNEDVSLLQEFEMKPNNRGFFYRSVRDENLAVAGAICADGKENKNPYTPPEYIRVLNNDDAGFNVTIPDVPFFKDTEKTGLKITK